VNKTPILCCVRKGHDSSCLRVSVMKKAILFCVRKGHHASFLFATHVGTRGPLVLALLPCFTHPVFVASSFSCRTALCTGSRETTGGMWVCTRTRRWNT